MASARAMPDIRFFLAWEHRCLFASTKQYIVNSVNCAAWKYFYLLTYLLNAAWWHVREQLAELAALYTAVVRFKLAP